MDFGDYDDFSHDNNPFAGSNHFYSNGILNATSSTSNNTAGSKGDYYNNKNILENHSSSLYPDNSNILGGLDSSTSPFGNDFNSYSHEPASKYSPSLTQEFHNTTIPINNNMKAQIHKMESEEEENLDSENDEDTTANYSELSISEQPTMYVNPAQSHILQQGIRKPNGQSTRPYNNNGSFKEPENSDQIHIKSYEILRDFKNVKTVFYKIELSRNTILRRYSDFCSLRSYLTKFHQTKLIPPVPEKHSLGKLIKNPFNYKSDTRIIERRMRLLEYFLNTLILDDDIRSSDILNKFLDPLEKNWSQILNSPPFTNLSSKSILLTSPRNPTIPNPYLVYLPIPPVGLLKNFNSPLIAKVFLPLELKLRKALEHVQNLETIVKNLVKDFQKNRLTLIELGGFFNIFSILEQQHQTIETFGNRIDLTFLNIEILVKSITVKIIEPLIILRLTLIAMIQLLTFRKLKELQLSYLQEIILRKQVRLKSIIERLISESKLNEVLSQSTIDSPSVKKALHELQMKRSRYGRMTNSSMIIINDRYPNMDKDDESFIRHHNNGDSLNGKQPGNWKTAIAGTSTSASSNKIHSFSSASHKSISKLTSEELNSELQKINLELNEKLIPCFYNLSSDIKFISINVEKNVNLELSGVVNKLHQIMYDWKTTVFGEFVTECLKVWTPSASN